MPHCTCCFSQKLIISPSVQVLWHHTVGNDIKTNTHFNCSIFSIIVHKISLCTKSMMFYNFENYFFPLPLTVFNIEMLTQQFSTRWHHRWFYSVAHGYFPTSRHHFYEYNSSHYEVKRATMDFSGHTIGRIIIKTFFLL